VDGDLYTAIALFPEHNPLIDEHVVYAVVLAGIAFIGAGRWLGFGNLWRKTGIMKKYPILE
jgi:thiosulfate dehydrogenase [quinone] large subunit